MPKDVQPVPLAKRDMKFLDRAREIFASDGTIENVEIQLAPDNSGVMFLVNRFYSENDVRDALVIMKWMSPTKPFFLPRYMCAVYTAKYDRANDQWPTEEDKIQQIHIAMNPIKSLLKYYKSFDRGLRNGGKNVPEEHFFINLESAFEYLASL